MENIKITLGTDYKLYGNSSGQQIDTLSMAVCGSDYNDIYDNSLDYLDQYDEYARSEYDYESDFIATLTAEQREAFITDEHGYQVSLQNFRDELWSKACDFELNGTHPLAVAIQEARDSAEHDLRHEWLYGDYRNAGMLADANKRYGVEFSYDEKTDTLTFDIDEAEIEDLYEYRGLEKKTRAAVSKAIANMIENDAIAEKNKRDARREENRKNYETRKRIEAEHDAEKEAARVRKLKG